MDLQEAKKLIEDALPEHWTLESMERIEKIEKAVDPRPVFRLEISRVFGFIEEPMYGRTEVTEQLIEAHASVESLRPVLRSIIMPAARYILMDYVAKKLGVDSNDLRVAFDEVTDGANFAV